MRASVGRRAQPPLRLFPGSASLHADQVSIGAGPRPDEHRAETPSVPPRGVPGRCLARPYPAAAEMPDSVPAHRGHDQFGDHGFLTNTSTGVRREGAHAIVAVPLGSWQRSVRERAQRDGARTLVRNRPATLGAPEPRRRRRRVRQVDLRRREPARLAQTAVITKRRLAAARAQFPAAVPDEAVGLAVGVGRLRLHRRSPVPTDRGVAHGLCRDSGTLTKGPDAWRLPAKPAEFRVRSR